MPRVSPIQESFAYGEIDTRVQSRVQTDAYKGGLKRALNWYPLVQGPIRMREGTLYQEVMDGRNWQSGAVATSGARCFTFQRGLDNDAIFELGEDVMTGTRFLIGRDSNGGAQLTDGESGNLVVDSQYVNPIPGVYWTGDPGAFDFNGGSGGSLSGPASPGTENAYMALNGVFDSTGQDFKGGALDRSSGSGAIIIPAGSELLINTITLDIGFSYNLGMAVGLGNAPTSPLKLRLQIGTTPQASDVLDATINFLSFFGRNDYVQTFTPGAGNNTLYMRIGWEWTGGVIPSCVPIMGPCNNQMSMWIYPATWTAPLTGASGGAVEFVSPWTADQMECIQWAQDPGEQFGVFTHPNVEPHVLKYVEPDWIFQPISSEPGYVAATGSVWAANDYPQAVEFHEGRLWLGGSPSFPGTLWASRSGVYVDFDAALPSAKDDPLLFAISNSGSVQTITSRKELVVNFDISEVIGSSVQGVIASDDFNFPKQTDWGSNCIQPMKIGRDMVYTSNSRKRVRTFADEGGTNFGWDGNELSLLAHDIFKSQVRRMVYLDEPGYQAVFLLSDGTLGVATFFYPENAIGWWRMEVAYNGNSDYGDENDPGLPNQQDNVAQPSNNIMDICKINTSQGAKLWMIVNRIGFAGTQNPGHELLAFDPGTASRAAMDSRAVRTPYDVFLDGNLRVDDIDELSDQSCSVLVEGVDAEGNATWTVHPNVTVIAGVSSPLEDWVAGQVVHIGLGYDNEIQLLSLEGVSNRGTSQSSKRRWNKVYCRLNDSPVPLIEGVYAKDRTPSSPMGQGEPLITGDTEIVDLGSGEGDLLIIQDRLITTEITGIFGKVQSSQV